MSVEESSGRFYSPTDPTIDLAPDSPQERSRWCRVVEGTGKHMTAETQTLLRSRLLSASLLLFIGSGLFLAWVFLAVVPALSQIYSETTWTRHLFHIALTVVEGACALILFSRVCMSSRWLRVFEVIIFGMPAAFFATLTMTDISLCCQTNDSHNMLAASYRTIADWLFLIVVYGMFVPNTWKRAAAVVVPMGIIPVAIIAILRNNEPLVAEAIPSFDVTAMGITMFIACLVAVYGTYTVHSLRTEVFEAKQLGQYTLGKQIGAGGMGEVFLAEHQLLKRPCAIKLIRPGRATDPLAMARFEREVKATAQLSHWNSVEIFDYGRTDDGTFYYVMEYLPGLSISDIVRQHGPMSAERVVYLLRQTCSALREAHDANLIHRDIKPGNIFAAHRGGLYDVAKLLDFGLVKTITGGQVDDLTQDGSISGSPHYMSPEQASGKTEPDARSDIYSLGAVAYFMLSGHPPFDGEKPLEILIAHARDEVVPPSRYVSGIPQDLEQIVVRCLAKSPGDRFQSAEELEVALSMTCVADMWSEQDAREWWASNAADKPEVAAV